MNLPRNFYMYNRESDGNFVNLQEKISLLTKHEHQQRQQQLTKATAMLMMIVIIIIN